MKLEFGEAKSVLEGSKFKFRASKGIVEQVVNHKFGAAKIRIKSRNKAF